MRLRTPEEEDGGEHDGHEEDDADDANAFQCSNHGSPFLGRSSTHAKLAQSVYLWIDPSSLTHDPLRKTAMKAKGGHMSEMEAQLSDIETGRCFACAQLFSTDEGAVSARDGNACRRR